jgi:hypothetical protein
MNRRFLVLLAASAFLACRPHPARSEPAVAAPRLDPSAPLPDPKEPLFALGLSPGWQDYGWAPHTLEAGKPAQLDLSNFGGWIVAHPGLQGRFGGLRVRFRAPARYGDFLEVRLDSELPHTYPRVLLDAAHRRPGPDGFVEAFVPMRELNPKQYPFDRVILRAAEKVDHEKVELALLAFTAPEPEAAEPPRPAHEVALTLDCRGESHEISPLIYGVAYDFRKDAEVHPRGSLGATARRWGGNPASRFNWKLGHAWNTGSDWYFRNVNFTEQKDFSAQRFIDEDQALGLATALTVPTLGWVAKDTASFSFPVDRFGPQQKVAPEDALVGNGFGRDGKPLQPGPAQRTSVAAPPEFIAEWVKDIRAHERGGRRTVQMYILDNEPSLWNSTHRDVHPEPLGYDELLDRTIRYARAIKEVDPRAVIAGPAEWGWPAYQYSAIDAAAGFALHPDRLMHGNVPLIPWWLRKLREYRERTGMNLVDVLDVHFYPQANGVGVDTQGDTDDDTNALRLRSTRALWDPTYVDESWIKEPVNLLPRLKAWIAKENPGMGISIGEWSFGAEEHMSGGLATAEALGRFGQAGITSAFYWVNPVERSPAYWAFRAYRDYDGQGARFLDTSVATHSSDALTSVFASRDARGKLVAVLLNLDPKGPAVAQVSLPGCATPTRARSFVYVGGRQGFVPGPAPLQQGRVRAELPPYSMTVVELEP